MIKTVVELDLKGYGNVAREIEDHLSAEAVLEFNQQLQRFVDLGLASIGVARREAVMATTGDGAILVFDKAADAHGFAVALHDSCKLHNQQKALSRAQRWFRVGIATGELAIALGETGRSIGGSVITRAVRLETAAGIGEVLADADTYAGLPSQIQMAYGPEEWVTGKGAEKYVARRCVVVAGLDWIPPTGRNVPSAAFGPALQILKEKLEFFQKELAVTTSAPARFELKFRINEILEQILELGGQP